MMEGRFQYTIMQHGKVDSAVTSGLIMINNSRCSVVNVICLNTTPFRPAPNRVQLYGVAGPLMYAFDTDYDPRGVEDIGEAIRWFAHTHLNYPDMQLSSTDPRPLVN